MPHHGPSIFAMTSIRLKNLTMVTFVRQVNENLRTVDCMPKISAHLSEEVPEKETHKTYQCRCWAERVRNAPNFLNTTKQEWSMKCMPFGWVARMDSNIVRHDVDNFQRVPDV